MAVAIVTPARGPSLGVAPAGTWMWTVVFSKMAGIEPELLRPRPDVAHPGTRRLLHHVAELAGQDEVVLAVHLRGLDLDDVAAGVADDEAGHHADLVLRLELAVVEASRPEVLLEVFGLDDDLRLRVARHACARPCATTLAISRSRFRTPASRVKAWIRRTSASSSKVEVASSVRPCALELLRHEEALRDPHSLELGVAGQLDDLHPVAQGRRDACRACWRWR